MNHDDTTQEVQPTPTEAKRPARRPRARKRQVARPGCRRPLVVFDRIKFLTVMSALFAVFVATEKSQSPLYSWMNAAQITWYDQPWLPVLFSVELARQIHYLVAEYVRPYWSGWTGLMALLRKPWLRLGPDTRHRLGRATSFVFWFTAIGYLLARIRGVSDPVSGWVSALGALWANLPMIMQILLVVAVGILQFVAIFWFMSKGGVEVVMPEDVKTTFDDVWGQDQVVAKVRETVQLLDDPDKIEAHGGTVPSGILLWGPPGTGKTLIAEAMAGETGKPFVMIEPGAFQAMFLGVNILKVKGLYRRLRKLAIRYGGVVAFFDEADVLGRRGLSGVRGRPGFNTFEGPSTVSCGGATMIEPTNLRLATGAPTPSMGITNPHVAGIIVPGGGGGDLGTLNAILASMQGLKKPRGLLNRVRRMLGIPVGPAPKYRILHVMATNMPNSLDDALLRPGRIDRHFRVGYPSLDGRIRTFWGYLDKVQHTLTESDVHRLATSSPYSSGAVIKDVVNEALISALREGRTVIEWRDIVSAKSLKQYGVTDGFEYIDRERHAVAVHEACHAVVAYRLKKDFQIDTATIERRGDVGGFVAPVPTVERMFDWKSHVEIDIKVFIASIAGERYFFDGDNSIGVGSDLEKATRLALAMETHWGMGDTLSSHGVLMEAAAGPAGAGLDNSRGKNDPRRGVGERVETRLRRLHDETRVFLEKNRSAILALAHALEVNGTLSGTDVEAVLDGTKGPLVDGTVYSRRDVKRELEAYHKRVLEAHHLSLGEVPVPRFDA